VQVITNFRWHRSIRVRRPGKKKVSTAKPFDVLDVVGVLDPSPVRRSDFDDGEKQSRARAGRYHGNWSVPGVPHRGWRCLDVIDNEEPDFLCEMCEVMRIRYIHIMCHPRHPPLQVGCVCAGNMEQNVVRARQREQNFKRLQSRRKKWLTRTWRVSAAGNDYLNVDGFNVVVFPKGDHWGARVRERSSGRERTLPRRYETKDAAKLAALDVMLDMRR
jgi:hypothetical protein